MKKYVCDVAPLYIKALINGEDYSEHWNWLENCGSQKEVTEQLHEMLLKISIIVNSKEFKVDCGHFYLESEFKTKNDYINFFKDKIEDILENSYMMHRMADEECCFKEKKNIIEVGINRCTYFQCQYCGNPHFKSLIFNTKDNSVSFEGGSKPCDKTQYVETYIDIENSLSITNMFDYDHVLNDLKYDINDFNQITKLTKDFAEKQIGYAQVGGTNINVYFDKVLNKVLFVYPNPKKETRLLLKGLKKVTTIDCTVWRVMFSDMKKSGVKKDSDDKQLISLKMEKGKYLIKTDVLRQNDIVVSMELCD
jgi:hypothetical protein